MKLYVIYGGQWGSEGKGQIAHYIASKEAGNRGRTVSVRVGGPNAGHTIVTMDGPIKVQQVPVAGWASEYASLVIGAGGVILPDILAEELQRLDRYWGGDANFMVVDRGAIVIGAEHQSREKVDIVGRISSTGEGVGAATADKIMRTATTFEDWLHRERGTNEVAEYLSRRTRVESTVSWLNSLKGEPGALIVEGTQGYMLSLDTSGYYPYTTSRNCGPEAIASQVGIPLRGWTSMHLVCTMRTFPIRVGGPSGPLPNEITWEDMREGTGGYVSEPEITTVTKKKRRIARWDDLTATRTAEETAPTEIALTFLDYVDPSLATLRQEDDPFTPKADDFIRHVEEVMGTPVRFVSFGQGKTEPWGDFIPF